MSYAVKYDPRSFFFTEPGAFTQVSTQAFGPVSPDEFRLTAGLTFSAGAPAYAICKGVVLIQPQEGAAGKVNLILRPFSQPVTGLNIKYFIYRGLNKADFFDGDDVLPAATAASDLVNLVNKSFTDYYAQYPGQSVPAFLAKYLGFDPAGQAATLSMDDLFFKQVPEDASGGTPTEDAALAFELPMMPMGASLGNFAAGECGMDVVLNFGDYRLPQPNDEFVFDLAYARAAASVINVAAISDAFKKKQVREQIFQFLDVAAFFGFHAGKGGSVKVKGTTEDAVKKGEQVYNELLTPFDTKNRVYLYIQSDRTRSYNFYGNYLIGESGPECLKMGATETALTARDYSGEGWPLLIDHDPRSSSEAVNNIYLQLVTDNNDNAMLYGQIAGIANAEGNNFCGAVNLRLPVADGEAPANLTRVIILGNPSVSSGGGKVNIATFNMLVYQGKGYSYATTDNDGNPGEVQESIKSEGVSDLFGKINAVTSTTSENEAAYNSIIIQRLNLINHFYNNTQFGVSAVQTSCVNDSLDTGDTLTPLLRRTVYHSESVDMLNNVTSVSGTVTGNNTSSVPAVGVTIDNAFKLKAPIYYKIVPFTDSGQTIKGLVLQSSDATIPSKLICGLTKSENELLKNLDTEGYQANSRLFLSGFSAGENSLVSTENIIYQKFKIGIVGENISGSLQLKFPLTDVVIYTLDNKYYHSEEFSRHLVQDTSITTLVLDLDISL